MALRQSEETLQQVWRQMRPPWPGLQIAAPPAAPLREGMPSSPAGEDQAGKRRNYHEGEQTRDATGRLMGGATGSSGPPDEPLGERGTSRPGVPGWSPGGQGAPAKSGRSVGPGQERLQRRGKTRAERAGKLHRAGGEGAGLGRCALAAQRLQAGDTRSHELHRGSGPRAATRGGACRPGSIKQEEPGDLAQPQAEEPLGSQPIKREEGETSQAEYQEN